MQPAIPNTLGIRLNEKYKKERKKKMGPQKLQDCLCLLLVFTNHTMKTKKYNRNCSVNKVKNLGYDG